MVVSSCEESCESAILELGTLGHILITASQELILGSCCSSSSTTTWSRVVQIENSSAAVTKSLWIEQQLLYRQEETSKEKINVGTNLSCHAGYKLMEAQMILWVQTYEDTIVGLWKGFGILCHSLWRENINGTSSLVSCLVPLGKELMVMKPWMYQRRVLVSTVNSCSTRESRDWWCTKGKGKINQSSGINHRSDK